MRILMTVMAIVVAVVALVSPFFVDGRHWMPRRRSKKRQ
jgi:hypothetical protein